MLSGGAIACRVGGVPWKPAATRYNPRGTVIGRGEYDPRVVSSDESVDESGEKGVTGTDTVDHRGGDPVDRP